jgi:hypothetical protein
MDSSGRHVCKDSYYTKRAGCNSASDRISVENDISRPQYMEYITLSANGIAGNIYEKTDQYKESVDRKNELSNINNVTGNFGSQYGANIKSTCSGGFSKHDTHYDNRPYNNQQQREAHSLNVGYNAQNRRNNSGF